MKLTYLQLKKILPELNLRVISVERMVQVFNTCNIGFYELPMEGAGGYVSDDGRDYVFLRAAMRQILHHETLLYEGIHALCHYPAKFLLRRHNLESEVLSLVAMMPLVDLPRLNRIKHQLDEESYDLLERRNKSNQVWQI